MDFQSNSSNPASAPAKTNPSLTSNDLKQSEIKISTDQSTQTPCFLTQLKSINSNISIDPKTFFLELSFSDFNILESFTNFKTSFTHPEYKTEVFKNIVPGLNLPRAAKLLENKLDHRSDEITNLNQDFDDSQQELVSNCPDLTVEEMLLEDLKDEVSKNELLIKDNVSHIENTSLTNVKLVLEENQSSGQENSSKEQIKPVTSTKNQTPKSFSCQQCNRSFSLSIQLKKHLCKHKTNKINSKNTFKSKRYNCTRCFANFPSKSGLIQHSLKHQDKTLFICAHCNQSFNWISRLKLHMAIHTSNKPHVCNLCKKSFRRKAHLKRHLNTHLSEHKCTECDMTFKVQAHLIKHLLSHAGINSYPCPQCNKKFFIKQHLNEHLLIHSTENRPHKCPECEKGFYKKSHLTRHMKIHSGCKPYACSNCDKKFAQRSQLNAHQLTHTGDKSQKCPNCEKSFGRKSNLTRHMATHLGLKPHVCPFCDKPYSQKEQLERHLLVHHRS